MKRQNVRP